MVVLTTCKKILASDSFYGLLILSNSNEVLRSRSDRSHGERCVTPARAAAKETNSNTIFIFLPKPTAAVALNRKVADPKGADLHVGWES